MTKRLLHTFLLLSALGTLSACEVFSDKKDPLPGERISVLELQKSLEPDDIVLENEGLITPTEWKNEFWPQAGGYPNHSMQNLALGASPLKKIWDTKIGRGRTDEIPLVAQPIVVDGRIFALNTKNTLRAFSIKDGKELWSKNVASEQDDDPVISGGIASSGGILYVTAGYNEALALDPSNGDILWRKALPAASRAAPTVLDGRVFVTTLDGRVIALSATSGAPLWEYTGLAEAAAIVGAASPAVSRELVVPVFSSGEITALRAGNGSVAWSDNLSNVSGLGGLAEISDIKALPVIDKGLVIGMSFSGRLAAIDERTGNRIWQREIGGSQTPWVAGNHVFVLDSENQLIALGRENGAIRWITELPRFDDDKNALYYSGPVLAGGRLVLINTYGMVYEISPEDGKILRNWKTGDPVSLPPIIAGGTMYILNDKGTLAAYR